MEVLKPAEPVVQQVTQRTDVPKELVDAGLTMKNVEILNHLGLQHQMFNSNVMEKVQFIADKVEDILMLQDTVKWLYCLQSTSTNLRRIMLF